jgi:hypothetical protein
LFLNNQGDQKMISYYVVDSAGQIHRRGTCQKHLLAAHGMGMSIYEGECPSPETVYAPLGVIQQRPVMPLVVTQNPFTITGIPTGTLVKYPGGELIVDDGFIEWSSAVPGEFAFQLSCFPYRDEVIYATFA